LRVCREGKPLRTFPDHALARVGRSCRETGRALSMFAAARFLRETGLSTVLVARWVGLVSATRRVVIASVSSGGSSADRSSADAYRHSTAYGCAAVNAATVCAAVINASAAHARAANASTICEGIS
jgi:hypothetical protein